MVRLLGCALNCAQLKLLARVPQVTSQWGFALLERRRPWICVFASHAKAMTSIWWPEACAAHARWAPSAPLETAWRRYLTGGACQCGSRADRPLKLRFFCGRRASNTSAVLFSCPMHSSCQSGPDAGDHACAVGCVLHAPCLVSGRFTPEGLVAVTLVQCVQFAVLAITPGVRFA